MSNNTSTPVSIPSLQSSIDVLARNFVPCVLWVPLGLLGAVTSALVIVTFFNKKPEALRSNYFFNVMHIAVADLFMALVHLCIGLKRSILLWTGLGEISTPLRCFVDMSLIQTSQVASAGQVVALAIDRLLAVAAPVWYHGRSVSYSWPINVFFWILSVAAAGSTGAFLSRSALIPTCSVGSIYRQKDPDFRNIQTPVQQTIVGITFGIYGLIVILLGLRRKKIISLNPSLSQAQLRSISRGNKLSAAVAAMYLVTWAVAIVFDACVTAFVEPAQQVRWFPYEPNFSLLALPGNFVLYWYFDADFRAALRKLASVTSSQVSHSGSSAIVSASAS